MTLALKLSTERALSDRLHPTLTVKLGFAKLAPASGRNHMLALPAESKLRLMKLSAHYAILSLMLSALIFQSR